MSSALIALAAPAEVAPGRLIPAALAGIALIVLLITYFNEV
ncbi:gluconate:H+ symporter, GntP family [Streptosporangium canum]|uniref:Gluconate:H+ symporter, GntP family n=1 Tax=Streptosporangium canum TaxID=324952 RepID=A0A1I4C479_9ACTN|nr:hypothetical protein [Streptosporangium canum]SFK74931.1 gluconate:H+ symporter, GntP family [Streptosporangium canum]